MRKRIISEPPGPPLRPADGWLDLESVAEVEITSEDPDHPIEAALARGGRPGWRAWAPGKQIVRIRFDEPRTLSRIRLMFTEDMSFRTQEFVLRWSGQADGRVQEIVRQQYNFSAGSTETEEYAVNLNDVKTVELEIVPSIAGGDSRASLTELRLR